MKGLKRPLCSLRLQLTSDVGSVVIGANAAVDRRTSERNTQDNYKSWRPTSSETRMEAKVDYEIKSYDAPEETRDLTIRETRFCLQCVSILHRRREQRRCLMRRAMRDAGLAGSRLRDGFAQRTLRSSAVRRPPSSETRTDATDDLEIKS